MTRSADIVPLHSADAPAALDAREDDQLMLLARAGRRDGFDALVKRHQQRVLAIAHKQLGDKSLAKDAAQEAFLELFRSLGRYQARGCFTAYLYRITLNQCRMAARSAGAEQRRRQALAAVPTTPAAELSEEALLQRERRRDVEQGLLRLSDKLRDVLVLRYAGEQSLKEIADTLELPLGTVKSRLFAGVDKLREVMEVEQ